MTIRGAKPGERRGGRAKGTPNKATLEIKEIAKVYGPDIIAEAAKMAGVVKDEQGQCIGRAESEQTRIAAMTLVMGYGYGKPSQTIGSDPDNPLPGPNRIEFVVIDPPKG